MLFELFAWRFVFRALDPVRFPAGKAGNVFRGALGIHIDGSGYDRFFAPVLEGGPSGFADAPRPFVLRAAHLDGQTLPAGERFQVGVHVFDARMPALEYLTLAFGEFAKAGLGPGRGRAELTGVEGSRDPLRFDLAAARDGVSRIVVEFVTPVELKDAGMVARKPEFGVLLRRLRDRISGLRGLYGAGPLEMDFVEQGLRADAVKMTRCDLRHERAERRSSRTGQTHPLGGFMGEAEYEGELGEFVPYLELGRYTGVGRQTVWGKGELRVRAIPSEPSPTARA